MFPGLINCHAHLGQVLSRGFNEDFGFPNSYRLAVQPTSLVSREEASLMVTVGALEAIRTGTTTIVENVGGIAGGAAGLAGTGIRCVFAESATDREGGSPMSPEILAKGEAPRFSAKMREEGLQRISDLYSAWHGKEQGRISVFPAAALAENSSPELLHAVRAFAEKYDLGYTIHLSQSRAEVDYVRKHHGVSPVGFLARHDFLSPRLFAAHCRYVDDADIALLAKSGTIVSHQAAMAANRGVIPPIPALRAAGVPIAMGTDNNTNDLFEVMRVAMLTERVRRDDEFPGVLPQPEDVLEDATLGSSRAVRQSTTVGLAGGRQEGGHPGAGYAAHPPRTVGAHRLHVDPQRPGLGHRVGHDRRPLRDARPQDPHRGRGSDHCRGRQGGTTGVGGGPEDRADCDSGAPAQALN